MPIADNLKDFNEAMKKLTAEVNTDVDELDDPKGFAYSLIDYIIVARDEWEIHLSNDIAELIADNDKQTARVSELEDCERVCVILEEKVNDRDAEIDALIDEVRALRNELKELQ